MATPSFQPPLNLQIQFERYKDTYRRKIKKSISFIGQDLEFFTQVKADYLLNLTRKYVGDPSRLKILDVGCGIGITDIYLIPHFRKLYGIDLSRGVVRNAAKLNPRGNYRHYAGKTLPYDTCSMDVTFAICVIHHVLPARLDRFLGEMIRVTKKGGLIVVFEHNPLNPLTRVAVSRCELDHEAILLRMGKTHELFKKQPVRLVEKKYILFTPFNGRFFERVDHLLGWFPLGAQYYIAAKK